MRGVAEHGDASLDPDVERVEVEDLDAIGGRGIEFRDEGLDAGRPVGELRGEHLARGAAFERNALGHRDVEEEVEAVARHRHHRHTP